MKPTPLLLFLLILTLLFGSLSSTGVGSPPGGGSSLAPNGAGIPPRWQASMRGSPDFWVNHATGNVFFSFSTSRFAHGVHPLHALLLHHNSAAVHKTGDFTGGFDLGEGWSSSVGGRLEFPQPGVALLTWGDGTEILFDEVAPGSWESRAGHEFVLEPNGPDWVVRTKAQWSFHYSVAGAFKGIEASTGAMYDVVSSGGQVTQVIDPTGRGATFTYRSDGKLEGVFDSLGLSWSFEYDTNGRLSDLTHPGQNTYSFLYDTDGRIGSITDPSNHTWLLAYYGPGPWEGMLEVLVEPDGATSRFTYASQADGRRTELEDPRNLTWTYVHDKEPSPALLEASNPLGHTWSYEHNVGRRLTKSTSPSGRISSFKYDANQNLTSVVDPEKARLSGTYDPQDKLLTSTLVETWGLEYHNPHDGTLVSSSSEPANPGEQEPVNRYKYFGPNDGPVPGQIEGLLKKVTGPLGVETRYRYTATGAPISEREGPVGAPGAFKITHSGTTAQFLDLGGMQYPSGFPALPSLPSPIQGRLNYQESGQRTWWGATASTTSQVEVPIDSGSGWEVSSIETEYTYDHWREITSAKTRTDEPFAHSSSPPLPTPDRIWTKTRDRSTGQSVITSPDGNVITIDRNHAAQISRISTNDQGSGKVDVQFTYSIDGDLESIRRNDGSSTLYSYYDDGLEETIEHLQGTQSVLKLEYEYDDRKRLTSTKETTPNGVATKSYTYDSRSQLASETVADMSTGFVESRHYEYDRAGNRVHHEIQQNGASTEQAIYHYDYEDVATYKSHNNRLTWMEILDGQGQLASQRWFFYDNKVGGISRMVRQDAGSNQFDSTALLYSDFGHPWLAWSETWEDSGTGPANVVRGDVFESRLDGFLASLKRRRSGTDFSPIGEPQWATHFGQWSASFTVDSSGTVQASELQTPFIGRLTPLGPIYSAHDRMLTPRIFLHGGSRSSQDFWAFGGRRSGVSHESWGFGGGMGPCSAFDGASWTDENLILMGQRAYAPSIGRFTSRDPVGLSGGINTYAFVENRVTQLVDPTGLSPQDPQGGRTDENGRRVTDPDKACESLDVTPPINGGGSSGGPSTIWPLPGGAVPGNDPPPMSDEEARDFLAGVSAASTCSECHSVEPLLPALGHTPFPMDTALFGVPLDPPPVSIGNVLINQPSSR